MVDPLVISNKRPISVTILACVYLGVGALGVVFHFGDLRAGHAFSSDAVWVELTEALAIFCGAFLIRGQNWARWLAVAWMAFHVVLSAFHAFRELAIHALFFVVITWILFRPPAARYFRRAQV